MSNRPEIKIIYQDAPNQKKPTCFEWAAYIIGAGLILWLAWGGWRP